MAAMRRNDVVNRLQSGAELGRSNIENMDLSNTEANTPKLSKATVKRVNLQDSIMSQGDFKAASFEQCNLRGVVFTNGAFRQARITHSAADGASFAHISGESFQGDRFAPRNGSFQGATLSFSQFTQCNFEGCTFREANLEGATFNNCVLLGADLSTARLGRAEFKGVDMRRAIMNGVDFRGFKIEGATMANAVLSEATIYGKDFSGLNWEKVDLNKSQIGEVDFQKTNLARASFRQAKILKAKFGQANLSNAYFLNAQCKEVGFQGTNLEDAYFVNASIQDADMTAANLTGANFANARLSQARFTHAELRNANFEGAGLSQVNFSGAKNMLFARWSPNALESFAKTKVKDHMFKDFTAMLGRLEQAKKAGDSDAVFTFIEDLERIYTTMQIIVDPEMIRQELQSLINWYTERAEAMEKAGDSIEAEDCVEKFESLSQTYKMLIGEAPQAQPKVNVSTEGNAFTIGFLDEDLVVRNFSKMLDQVMSVYEATYTLDAEEGFGLDNLLHKPFLLRSMSSDPWEVTFAGEGKGLAVLAHLFLQSAQMSIGGEVAKLLQERSNLEQQKQSVEGEQRKVLGERISLIGQKVDLIEGTLNQVKRGQADIKRVTEQLGLFDKDAWRKIDQESRVGKFAELGQVMTQMRVGGHLSCQLGGQSVFDLTVRSLS